MSVCVNVRTNKDIEPNDFLMYLVNKGEQIIVTCDEFPSVKFGNHHKAIRGIEVNQEDNGYEVRVCSFSSVADYELFPNVILNPDKSPMVTTRQLQKAIPSFDWSGGHSGRMLSPEEALAIETIWADFINNNAKNIDGVNMNAININH